MIVTQCWRTFSEAKYKCPRNLSSSKEFSTAFRPSLHVVGCVVHGVIEIFFICHADVQKSSNTNITLLCRHLWGLPWNSVHYYDAPWLKLKNIIQSPMVIINPLPSLCQALHNLASISWDPGRALEITKEVLARRQLKLPHHIAIQTDNTTREQRNSWTMLWSGWMVGQNIVTSLEECYYRVGHTHNEVDQRFWVISSALSKETRLECPEDISWFKQMMKIQVLKP